MVNIGAKPESQRTAIASARVNLGDSIYELLKSSLSKGGRAESAKGDVFTTAQLAGIMGAKQTAALIPLCHPVPLAHVSVDLTLEEASRSVRIATSATTTAAQTGVEMEALTAASVAALTVYDMCKAGGKGITISDIQLEHKSGGVGGDFQRGDPASRTAPSP